MTHARPRIGIGVELEHGAKRRLVLPALYAERMFEAGGLPLLLPPIDDGRFRAELLAEVDGVLLPGGDDFDAERIGLGPTHPAAQPIPTEKQDQDFALARHLLTEGVPVLGICYGMQLLALAEGGTLVQDLPDERPGSQAHGGKCVHPVEIEPGTKLAAALGVSRSDCVSSHHQAVASVGAGWVVAAVDDEGLIEAVERSDHPFAVGVQWHPELSPEGDVQHRLFTALVAAAGERASARGALSC